MIKLLVKTLSTLAALAVIGLLVFLILIVLDDKYIFSTQPQPDQQQIEAPTADDHSDLKLLISELRQIDGNIADLENRKGLIDAEIESLREHRKDLVVRINEIVDRIKLELDEYEKTSTSIL